MSEFFEVESSKEYLYKAIVWPNWTFQEDLNKDSFTIVFRNIIDSLREKKIHWTILVPKKVSMLRDIDVEQIVYDTPSYPNSMRCDFQVKQILNIIDWKHKDFDFIYCHCPEHANNLINLFYNVTDTNPIPIFGYCHWYEIAQNTAYSKTMFNNNIIGTLNMKECGVNSKWLKELIINEAKETFTEKIVDKLRDIIQPHYLGVDKTDWSDRERIPNSILFNHRDNEYTGYNWFIEQMDELYKNRKDFVVYVTTAEPVRPYMKKVVLNDRSEYLKFIRSMKVGVGCFQKYSAWSISVTDGLSQLVPYILPDKMCYPEMLGSSYPLYYKNDVQFKENLIKILDDDLTNYELAINEIKIKLNEFSWKGRIEKWFDNWNIFNDNNFPVISETESYKNIIMFLKRSSITSKNDILKHLGWGVRISWNLYRNRLRKEKNVKFTKDGYEWIEEKV